MFKKTSQDFALAYKYLYKVLGNVVSSWFQGLITMNQGKVSGSIQGPETDSRKFQIRT